MAMTFLSIGRTGDQGVESLILNLAPPTLSQNIKLSPSSFVDALLLSSFPISSLALSLSAPNKRKPF
jgi:hypothetical protein